MSMWDWSLLSQTLETLNWEVSPPRTSSDRPKSRITDDQYLPHIQEHLKMYATCALAPPFLAAQLAAGHNFAPGAKFLLVTTEGGSISLRTSDEGGSNYGHHGSKAAQNMVGRLLSLDLAPKGVTVVNVHVSGQLCGGRRAAAEWGDPAGGADWVVGNIVSFVGQPGFMKTDMTKGVGFDEFYESGGAVEPEEAAKSLLEFAATVTKEHNGQFWAPRGPGT